MVLKQDSPFGDLAPWLALAVGGNAPRRILRLVDALLECLGCAVVLEHLDAVEPMLHLGALGYDHTGVPLADALENPVRIRREDIVERCGLAVAVPALGGIGMAILEDLILLARGPIDLLVVEILDAGIRGSREAEVELERKIPELGHGHDISAAAELLVFGRKLEPAAVGSYSAYGKHRKGAVLDYPALGRRSLEALLDPDPAVHGLAVPEKLPALGLLGGGERVSAFWRTLHDGLGLDAVGDAAVIAERFGKPHRIVRKILFVLDVAYARVAHVGESLENGGYVKLAARAFLGDVPYTVDLDVLDVHIENSLAMFFDELHGIVAGAALVPDVQAYADAPVAAADALDGGRSGGKELRNVRAVIVDGVKDVILLDEPVHDVKDCIGLHALLALAARLLAHLERDANDHLDPELLRELKLLSESGFIVRVERPRGERLDACLLRLGDVLGNLVAGGAVAHEEILVAEIAAIYLAHYGKALVERFPVERVARDADLERNSRRSRQCGNTCANEYSLFHENLA